MKPEDLINNIQQATNLVAPFRKQIKLLAEENNALKSKLAKAREALEFYADRGVWGNGCAAIDPCDTYTDELNVLRGGHRAREALKEIGE